MEIKPEVQWIIYGVLMVLVVYTLPQGIVPAIERYMSGRKRAPADDAPLAEPKGHLNDRAGRNVFSSSRSPCISAD